MPYVICIDYKIQGKKAEISCWAVLINFVFISTVSTVNYRYSLCTFYIILNYNIVEFICNRSLSSQNIIWIHNIVGTTILKLQQDKHKSCLLVKLNIIYFAFSIIPHHTFIRPITHFCIAIHELSVAKTVLCLCSNILWIRMAYQ